MQALKKDQVKGPPSHWYPIHLRPMEEINLAVTQKFEFQHRNFSKFEERLSQYRTARFLTLAKIFKELAKATL